ncbi:MAG: hypothetical protein ACRYG4_25580 [Janthinobacterium lividum]
MIAVACIALVTYLVGHFRTAILVMFGISGAHGQSIIFASIFGVLSLMALFLGAMLLGIYSPEGGAVSPVWRVCRNVLVTLIGAIAGWAVAVMYTPFGDADAARLHSMSQAITVFASGYLISKFDRFLEKSLFGADGATTYAWLPMGLAVCAFLSTSVMTFEARQYANDPDGVAVRFTAAPNAQLQAGDATLAVGKDHRLRVAGKDYGPVTDGAQVKFVIATQNVYVNGDPVEQVRAATQPAAAAIGGATTPAPVPNLPTPVEGRPGR